MNANDPKMIVYRAQNSAVLVKTENETVNGFFVREGLVATSSRILEDGADRIYLQRSTDDQVLFHVDGAAFQDSESGIAVLRVSSLMQRVLPLSVGSLQVGERVYMVENIEKDSRTVWREATVSGFQTDSDMPRILFDGSVPSGAVGSAVLNDQSEAVGVIVDVPTGGGTFAAMPSAQLKEAVAQIKHDGSRRIDTCQATIRFGKGPVRCLVFSPDGRTLAVGSSFAVWLYDVETGAQQNRFRAWQVQALAFSSDGKTLAAAEEMGEVFLWDVETGQSPILTPQRPGHNYDAKALAFSPDGRILMSGSCDDVALFDLQAGELIARSHRLEIRTSYNAHAFSPDGQTVASSCGGTVQIWNPETQEGEITLKGHTDRVQAMSYSADGRTLITGGDDKTIRIWNAETGECVKRWKTPPSMSAPFPVRALGTCLSATAGAAICSSETSRRGRFNGALKRIQNSSIAPPFRRTEKQPPAPAGTRRSDCGTSRRARRRRLSKGIREEEAPPPSPPTERRSQSPPTTRSGCGTPKQAWSDPY